MKFKLKYIMLGLALSVAGCAAYFSVWGLSQLFAGASGAVIIMASILEIGKIVTTTALHTYWDKLAKGLRAYLTVSVVILMLITSAGIYGFLSNAYQTTANKLEIHDGELGVLEGKKLIFEKTLIDNQKIIENKGKRIDQLSSLRTTQEARLDGSTTNRGRSGVRGDIAGSDTEIQKLTGEIDALNIKNGVLSDSIGSYNVKALEIKAGSEIAGEIGPLKYISELTDVPMANIVNYMILLLIFVFDPLAVALILMTNKIFILEEEPKKTNETPIVDIIRETTQPIEEPIGIDIYEEEENEPEEEIILEKQKIIEEVKSSPNVTRSKIELEDIKEIKERNRGFSVNVPEPKTNNMVERIGSNKILRDGDNNNIYFKRE